MSEELLSNDRRVQKDLTLPGFEPMTSRLITICNTDCVICPSFLLCCNRLYISNKLYFGVSNRDHSKMTNESVKRSLEKSKNVLEEKSKMVKPKICIKQTNTFTIIAMKFVQEQLIKHCSLIYICKKIDNLQK